LVLILRLDGRTPLSLAALRRELQRFAPDLDLSGLQTMRQALSASLAPQRFLLVLVGAFALCALILAALGIYGVMSHLVTLRTREIGIRLALGATRREVMAWVLRRGATLTLTGLAIGFGLALAVTRLIASVLYQTSPTDPLTFTCVPWVLGASALLACWIPARRAARVDPMIALRHD
jgi:ABC-type antimicrobial peptide transport system permease subunit